MFIITLNHEGATFYLRSTVTTLYRDRATEYESREAAQAGIDKAAKFHKAKTIKAMQIEEV